MKDIKKKLEEYYNQLNTILDTKDDTPRLLHRQNTNKNEERQELITGIITLFLIVTILLSMGYYFLYFAPQQEQLNNLKQEKINRVNTLLTYEESPEKIAIISEIENCQDIKSLDNMDIDAMIYPILKNLLLNQLNEYKDRYDRVEVHTANTTDIMKTDNARKYIESRDSVTLSSTCIKPVDSVIMPLSINRRQAASGLITQGNIVDIYAGGNYPISNEDETGNDSTYPENDNATKIAGGCQVVSILRSKDSASIDQNLELSQFPKNRNYSQSSTLDIQQILSSKAAGVYDEKQVKILLEDYATRLSNYERISKIGELDVEYIIMLEVPKSSVEYLINNMDNIILTIPTYDAPSWVRL